MSIAKKLIGVAVVVVGLPVAPVVFALVSTYLLDETNGTLVSSHE